MCPDAVGVAKKYGSDVFLVIYRVCYKRISWSISEVRAGKRLGTCAMVTREIVL